MLSLSLLSNFTFILLEFKNKFMPMFFRSKYLPVCNYDQLSFCVTFVGENCQTEINICVTADPCRNGGQCVVIGQSHQCNCPVGFMGQDCEIGKKMQFKLLGFIFIFFFNARLKEWTFSIW